MWWYFDDLLRVKHEREAIDALVDEGIGVENVRWRLTANAALRVEADLRVGNDVRSVALTYPLIFPNAPPTVRPIGDHTVWGGHQYLTSGELCLEYRPDNWHPDYTGAHMLRSALALMAADVGVTHQSAWDLPSAHVETPASELRRKWARLVLTAEAQQRLRQLTEPRQVNLRRSWLTGTFMMTLATITEPDGKVRSDTTLPTDCLDNAVFKGLAVPVAANNPLLPAGPIRCKCSRTPARRATTPGPQLAMAWHMKHITLPLFASLALAANTALASIATGETAPAFEAPASLAGKAFTFSLKDALAHGPVVVYFYPSAYTGGCNLEAHTFAVNLDKFKAAGASVVGVSLDDIGRLNAFSADPEYCAGKLPVASDAGGRIARAYALNVRDAEAGRKDTRGDAIDHGFAERSTFVVGTDGRVVAALDGLSPVENVERSLAIVQGLAGAKP